MQVNNALENIVFTASSNQCKQNQFEYYVIELKFSFHTGGVDGSVAVGAGGAIDARARANT